MSQAVLLLCYWVVLPAVVKHHRQHSGLSYQAGVPLPNLEGHDGIVNIRNLHCNLNLTVLDSWSTSGPSLPGILHSPSSPSVSLASYPSLFPMTPGSHCKQPFPSIHALGKALILEQQIIVLNQNQDCISFQHTHHCYPPV